MYIYIYTHTHTHTRAQTCIHLLVYFRTVKYLSKLGGFIRIIIGWISRRWDVGMWTGLGWPRIGTGGGRL